MDMLKDFLIGATPPPPAAEVPAPELGAADAKVYLRPLPLWACLALDELKGQEVAGNEAAIRREAAVLVFAHAVTTAAGVPLFDAPLTPEDRTKLGTVPMPVVHRAAAAAMKVMQGQEEAAGKA